MPATSIRLDFPGHSGASLSARLDKPLGEPRAYAIFAHCFTCSKDLVAVRRISAELVKSGIAVLRFDFTGLGSSEGDFASTNFSSNVEDLLSAAEYLRENYRPASLLIGHSLGAAGSVEFVATALGIYKGFIPPSINVSENIITRENIKLVKEKGIDYPISLALSNSFGFSGNMASVAIKRFN